MDESQARHHLTQMRNFILREAEENSEMIRSKAMEEYHIEKATIVVAAKKKIALDYEKKEKLASVQKRTTISQEFNHSRIEILQAQDDCILQVSERARSQLSLVSRNTEKYRLLLQKLIIQCLEIMREPDVLVICREQDRALIESVLVPAKQAYEASTAITLSSISLNPRRPLPPDCCGGVVLTANGGRVSCNNTLETRLQLAVEKKLPEIRHTLFPNALHKE
ncbi:V-type proton-ATPase [Pelomyxa schiedti]|nr:V-type proton-ATPase [Pelomyxa schiedti]